MSPHIRRLGIFSGEELEARLDGWIRESSKLTKFRADLPAEGHLTFGDIRRLGVDSPDDEDSYFPPLILTTTNVSKKKLVFIKSYMDEFANLSIARAVRASAGFPLFFRPIEAGTGLESGRYVDGGIFSNFPAWVFSSQLRNEMSEIERYADVSRRPWLNIGLTQVASSEQEGSGSRTPSGAQKLDMLEYSMSLFSLLSRHVRNELERTLTSRLPHRLAIEQDENETNAPRFLLDIDGLTDDKIRAMFARGEEAAEAKLERLSFKLPRGSDAETIREILTRLISQVLSAFQQPNNDVFQMRANVFICNINQLTLKYHANMDDDDDRNLGFEYDQGLTGACYRERAPFVCNLGILRELAEAHPNEVFFNMTHEVQSIVRADRSWLASVPVFDPVDSWVVATRNEPPGGEQGDLDLVSRGEQWVDGAVLGVLNLDAALPYSEIGLSPNTREALTDVRIQNTLALMRDAATQVGTVLSSHFAKVSDHE